MKNSLFQFCCKRLAISAMTGAALFLEVAPTSAQGLKVVQTNKPVVEQGQSDLLQLKQRVQVTYDSYILGPGDGLQIELLDLPELSGRYTIGPDGTIYLPRLRALYVEDLTIEELRTLLTQEFSTYVRDPQIYVRPVAYRPIRVYVDGEVKRPGYYTLMGVQSTAPNIENEITGGSSGGALLLFPTVFDAIRSAQGITPFTDLSQVQVIRKRPEGLGGGRIKTKLNFLSLMTEGDKTQNIRLFDGDTLNIAKSQTVLRDQLLKASQSNLSPQFMEVFVGGRVKIPGGIKIPQASSLNQAISLAGGTKLLKGKVQFVRFNREGKIDRRIFAYNPGAAADSPNNPVLAAGDIIMINESFFTRTTNIINEITSPFVGLYSAYALFNGIAQ